jgi:hypothetical protein
MQEPRLVHDAETRTVGPASGKSAQRGQFIPPIPTEWFTAAVQLPGKALAVAAIIHFEAAKQHTREIKLTGRMTENFNIRQMARQRAIAALEAAGLILIERKRGSSPMVTIIDLD